MQKQERESKREQRKLGKESSFWNPKPPHPMSISQFLDQQFSTANNEILDAKPIERQSLQLNIKPSTKYLIRKLSRVSQSFTHLYYCRYQMLKPRVESHLPSGTVFCLLTCLDIPVCNSVLDLTPNSKQIIIGIVYKEMKKRPSLIKSYKKTVRFSLHQFSDFLAQIIFTAISALQLNQENPFFFYICPIKILKIHSLVTSITSTTSI